MKKFSLLMRWWGILVLVFAAVFAVQTVAWGDEGDEGGDGAQEDCDNEDPPDCDEEEECDCDIQDGTNRFDVYSANVKRPIEDMRAAVKIGEHPLVFGRHHSSRTSWAVRERTDFPFGRAGNWRHSHQWTILDDGETNGFRKLQVIAPDGRVSYYNKKSPDDLFLTYLPSTHSRVEVDGTATNYYLYKLDGTKYHITQWGNTNEPTFRMEGFWDAYSNWYGYVYDADGYLSRVTGPNTNHYFALEYRPLEGAVPPGWVRFTYTNAAAAEVLLPATWNGWIGSLTPMQNDGSGVWTADVELSEGFYQYKFAVRNTGSSAWQMLADPSNPLVVGSDSNSLAVVSTEKIISKVTGGDGREVAYTYDWDWNPTQHMLAMRLREVAYGTGESALYDYYPASTDQGRSILLKSADDPHNRGAGRSILYTYHTNRPFSGQIHQEKQLSTGQVLAALEYDGDDPSIHYVLSADGSEKEYTFVPGCANTASKADAAGRRTTRSYFGGNGMLKSRTDPMDRTTHYTRTWHFGAVLSVSNGCGCRRDVIKTYTDEIYPFYLATKTDAAGNTTTYQRDDRHRPIGISHPDGTSEFFAYNENGQILWERRRDGTAWTNTYDARGRKIAVSGPAGAWTGYGYDAFDRVTSETNAVGLVTRHEYDWEGRKTRTLHPDGTEQRWAYDRYGSVTQSVDRAGGVTTHEYDERGNRIRTTDPLGAVTVWTYDAKGRKLTETTPLGLVISNTYDNLDRLVLRTYSGDGTGESWTHVYDGISTHTDRLGNVTSNSYDFEGHLVSVTDARGNTTSYAYDILGRRTAVTDALGHTTTQTFDPAGHVTSVTDAAGLAQTNTYDAYGRLAATVRRGGFTNEFLYDALNRRIETLLNGQTIASSAYDPASRALWTRNADGLVVSNVYDNAGRLWKTVMPDGTFTENTYSNAFLWQTTDRAGRTTTTDRNIAGRPVRVTDPAGRSVLYRYDLVGNLTNLIDQAGTVTAWTYDAEGRQTRKTYADGTHYDYTYDALGRLATRTDAKGITTTYAYDPNGNLTNILYPDSSTVTFAYDALNRKTSMSDSIGTVTYAYDALGNLVVEDGPFANDTLYYDYTPDRQLAAITSSFYKVEYAYDSIGRLSTVIGAEGTNTYAYAAAGTLWTNLTLANGTTAERQFDALLRLTNLVNRADAGVLSSFALTLDDADQRTQVIREDGKIYTYGYDAIGQLTNASATLPDGTPWSGYQFSYTYDATGNPIEQHKNGLVYSNSFNNLNQNVDTIPSGTLTVLGDVNYPSGTATVNTVQAQIATDGTFAAPGIPITIGTNTLASVFTDPFGRTTNTETTVTVSPKTYGYDLNGNLTNDSRFVYSWDYENRLTAVHDAQTGALVQSNRYDALWRRREKVECAPDGTAITNRYIYRDWLVLAINDASGNILETYTHGADLSGQIFGMARGVGGILTEAQSSPSITSFHYYLYDFNGTVVSTTTEASLIDGVELLSPFGDVLPCVKEKTNRFRYSTKEYDAFSELNYYGYRYYHGNLGRWLNRDPLQEMSDENLYSFVGENPIQKTDSLGLDCIVWDGPYEVGDEWEFVDVQWKAIGNAFQQFIEDAEVTWRMDGEVVCCCDGDFVTNEVSKTFSTSVAMSTKAFGGVAVNPAYLPMTITVPSGITGAVTDYLESQLLNQLAKAFDPLKDSFIGEELALAIVQTQPKSDDVGVWPQNQCEE